MSEENNFRPPTPGKYDKHFRKKLREDEFEQYGYEEPAVDPNIYEQAPVIPTEFFQSKNLIVVVTLGILSLIGLALLATQEKKPAEDFKPKTRKITRTVYVKREDDKKEDKKEDKKDDVKKDKDGNEIKEETEENYDL
jgi:hypothetical protein